MKNCMKLVAAMGIAGVLVAPDCAAVAEPDAACCGVVSAAGIAGDGNGNLRAYTVPGESSRTGLAYH